ncbi:MAG: tol-pal system protein YbgF [Polyangiales bacterium]
MHEELARVEGDHESLSRRVGELEGHEEMRRDDSTARHSPTAPASKATVERALRVVKLEPATTTIPELPAEAKSPTDMPAMPSAPTVDEESEGPRPLLRIGKGGAIEQTFPDGPTSAAKFNASARVFEPQAATDYDAAFALIKAKKLKQALDAFAGFVLHYPDHPYVPNAIYWRGDCYFALGDFTTAAGQLEGLIARFPASPKVPDALVKLGLSHKKLGSTAKARAAFDRLRKEFPLSEAAKKIPAEDTP